jgi:PD-(D/E)XK nuclease superfamily protein
MRLPDAPKAGQFKRLTPTLYEAALSCKARARWMAFGDRAALPQHPQAILGSALHAVLEAAHKGNIADADQRTEARRHFDTAAKELYERAHPLVRNKFSSPERLPYYNLFRERAALLAVGAAASSQGATHSSQAAAEATSQRGGAEHWLETADRLLAGRSDYVNAAAGEVVDYKTGAAPDDVRGMHESEVRQLRFYAHLALSSGIRVTQGAIVRADGRRVVLGISDKEAAAEGERARQTLAALNSAVDKPFEQLAEPSPRGCRYCPCIPFCRPFWLTASPDWAVDSGLHVEGRVTNVSRGMTQGMAVLALDVLIERGTVAAGPAVLEQLPESWAIADGSAAPKAGDLVRIMHVRVPEVQQGPTLVRADRVASAIWTVEEQKVQR